MHCFRHCQSRRLFLNRPREKHPPAFAPLLDPPLPPPFIFGAPFAINRLNRLFFTVLSRNLPTSRVLLYQYKFRPDLVCAFFKPGCYYTNITATVVCRFFLRGENSKSALFFFLLLHISALPCSRTTASQHPRITALTSLPYYRNTTRLKYRSASSPHYRYARTFRNRKIRGRLPGTFSLALLLPRSLARYCE